MAIPFKILSGLIRDGSYRTLRINKCLIKKKIVLILNTLHQSLLQVVGYNCNIEL